MPLSNAGVRANQGIAASEICVPGSQYLSLWGDRACDWSERGLGSKTARPWGKIAVRVGELTELAWGPIGGYVQGF